MSAPLLALHHVDYALPDGRLLFQHLDFSLENGITALVGTNGCGKTTLLNLLRGQLSPSRGTVIREGVVCHVAQHQNRTAASIAAAAGLEDAYAAWLRLNQGCADDADYTLLESFWTVFDAMQQSLNAMNLAGLTPFDPPARLSGGQLKRLALTAAWAQNADFVLLDEPDNHLDATAQAWLRAQIRDTRAAVLLVSHRPHLLRLAQRIVTLSGEPARIKIYGGSWDDYGAEQRRLAALHARQLANAHAEHKKQQHRRQQQHDARQRHAARAQKSRAHANMPKIALDKRQGRAEQTQGKHHQQQENAHKASLQHLRACQAAAEETPAVLLSLPASHVAAGKLVFSCENLRLPYTDARIPDKRLYGAFRLHVTGDNGCGKSTLLRLMAQTAQVPSAWIAQHPTTDAQETLLQALARADCPLPVAEQRTRLARLGLDAACCTRPLSALSGGEAVKAALALAVWRREPAQLLLLDESDNHLDPAAAQALADCLRDFAGAVAVVSHDADFVQQLDIDTALRCTGNQWTWHSLHVV